MKISHFSPYCRCGLGVATEQRFFHALKRTAHHFNQYKGMVRHDMNLIEWDKATQEFNTEPQARLFNTTPVSFVTIGGLIFAFMEDFPFADDNSTYNDNFNKWLHACTNDINNVCQSIHERLDPTGDNLGLAQILQYFIDNPPYSITITKLFADYVKLKPQNVPDTTAQQRTVENVTLYLFMEYFAHELYKQDKPFWAYTLTTKALQVLGGAKVYWGLSSDTILTNSIHQQKQSEQGRIHALKHTQKHRDEKKRLGTRYLQIMKDNGFKTYAETADYIYIKDNKEDKSHRWIYDTLSKADQNKL